ncbi:MAG: hypothetical protein JJU05_04380 [Verrucomicrobia bacterium]|nr:hypothetical protein [Verrucomicrobiota bacterium]MCH8525569.1 hypothetical protein [Kiritimatiellia bacterium]
MNRTLQVCILGAGGSGLAAARLLSVREGLRGRVCSEREPDAAVREAFLSVGFEWDAAGPAAGDGRVVVSPGFAAEHPWLERAGGLGSRVEAEAELGSSYLKGRILAITGSLGKTTMAMLAADLLRAHGYSVTLSGNIGVPVCEVALERGEADWHVLELSSFQTEMFQRFRPDVGVILNLVPNHLDRHGTMARYAEAKARMVGFQEEGDLAVIPEGYPVRVGTRGWVRVPDPARVPDTRGTGFDFPAYRANLAGLMTGLAEVPLDAETVRSVLEGFRFPPHRMEVLTHGRGGLIVDDSKSTCLSATRAAMEAVAGPMHVIIGGVHKGDPPEMLIGVLRNYPVSLYLFGASAEVFAASWQGHSGRCGIYPDLTEAVKAVFLHRKEGEPLLFSPGCASFDQYSSYMERGQHFQHLIEAFINNPSDSKPSAQEKP